jgi:redox-sensitive bicupin YhaK (pirin superfamily)
MITLRRSEERGHTRLNWLDSYHTFSFGDYHDPRYMGYRTLRVINEDRVKPAAGFPTHAHREMEIVTYVLAGAVAHKDSTGTSSVIEAGEVQRMSAGTGISHSEYNASKTEPAHFLQIWIVPDQPRLPPSYQQRSVALEKNTGHWVVMASANNPDGAVKIHQDIELLLAQLASGQRVTYRLREGRHAWLHIVRGTAALNDTLLKAGDGAAMSGEQILEIAAADSGEVLLFDLS